jgi:hypothetical protein
VPEQLFQAALHLIMIYELPVGFSPFWDAKFQFLSFPLFTELQFKNQIVNSREILDKKKI